MGFLTSLVEPRARVGPTASPASGADWLNLLLGGASTASGISVTADSAMRATAVWRAVNIIAGSLATMPLRLMTVAGNQRAQDRDHPLHRVLTQDTNERQTAPEFLEMMAGHLELRGNAFAVVESDRRGRVTALWPLHPDRITIYVANDGRQLTYTYRPKRGGQEIPYRADEILHLRGFSTDGIVGLSPIGVAAEAVGTALAAEQHAAAFFGNSASPSGVLVSKKALSKEAKLKLKEAWEARFKGRGAHRVAVLEEDLSWQQIGMTSRDAQFLETRKFQIDEVARLFGVPPHMLGSLERSTWNNVEQQGIDFVTHCLRPRAVKIERRLESTLLLGRERPTHQIRFNLAALLRGDQESRFKAYGLGRQWGWLSVDDIRELEDLNPLPDGKGQNYLQPANMVVAGAPAPPASPPAEPPPPPPPPAGADDDDGDEARHAAALVATLPVFRDAVGRAWRKLVRIGQREFQRTGLPSGHGEFLRPHEDDVRDMLRPAVESLAHLAGTPRAQRDARLPFAVDGAARSVRLLVGDRLDRVATGQPPESRTDLPESYVPELQEWILRTLAHTPPAPEA